MELNVIEQVIRVADGKGIMHIKERQLVGCINPKRESLDTTKKFGCDFMSG